MSMTPTQPPAQGDARKILDLDPGELIAAAMVRGLDEWPDPFPKSPRDMSDRLLLEMLAERLKIEIGRTAELAATKEALRESRREMQDMRRTIWLLVNASGGKTLLSNLALQEYPPRAELIVSDDPAANGVRIEARQRSGGKG